MLLWMIYISCITSVGICCCNWCRGGNFWRKLPWMQGFSLISPLKLLMRFSCCRTVSRLTGSGLWRGEILLLYIFQALEINSHMLPSSRSRSQPRAGRSSLFSLFHVFIVCTYHPLICDDPIWTAIAFKDTIVCILVWKTTYRVDFLYAFVCYYWFRKMNPPILVRSSFLILYFRDGLLRHEKEAAFCRKNFYSCFSHGCLHIHSQAFSWFQWHKCGKYSKTMRLLIPFIYFFTKLSKCNLRCICFITNYRNILHHHIILCLVVQPSNSF